MQVDTAPHDHNEMFSCIKATFSVLEMADKSPCGDIYGFHILLAIGMNIRPDRAASPNGGGEQPGLNTLSIAQMTGIPRETVRRKLKTLVANGLIAVGPDKTYVLSDIDELTDRLKPLLRFANARRVDP